MARNLVIIRARKGLTVTHRSAGYRGSEEKLQGWFAGRLPDDWFEGQPEITTDREEILIVGKLLEPTLDKGASDETKAAGRVSRIERFREETVLR